MAQPPRPSFWQHLKCRAFHRKILLESQLDDDGPGPPSSHTVPAAANGQGGEDGEAPHFVHLKRQLGLFELTLIGIGGSIGAGVFSLTGIAAAATGPAVVFSYIFAGLIAAVDALCYAEMSSRYPQAGTVFLYAHATFGELPALLVALNLLVDYHVAASLIARSFATYLVEFLRHAGVQAIPGWVSSIHVNDVINISFIAPLLLLALTLVLCRGAEWGAVLNIILTTIKMAVIVLVCAVGLTHLRPANWLPFFPMGFDAVFPTSATVFFSYVGFDVVASSSEECVNPLRDLPRAIMLSLGVCVGLYCAVCLVITGMIPYSEIDLAAPLSSAFKGFGQPWVQTVIALGGVVGLATTLLIGLYAQARIYLGISRDGLLPPALAAVHPSFKTPANAQWLCGGLAMAMAALFNVKLLSEILDIGVIVGYGAVCASVLVQRSPPPARTRTTRGLCLLVAAAAVPFTLLKYHALGDSPILLGVSFLLPAAALVPLVLHQEYPPPAAAVAFSCPGTPYLPLAGVVLNVYMAVQLHVWAWLRLLVLWALLLGYYVYTEMHYHKQGKDRGGRRLRCHDDDGGSAVPGSPSSESLRRRSSRQQPSALALGGGPDGSGGGGGGGGNGGGASHPVSPLRRPLIPKGSDEIV